jgi:hypothetical protein
VLFQVAGAVGVVDGAVGGDGVGEGGSVLGDVQLADAVVVGQPHEERLPETIPAGAGSRAAP